MTLAKLSRHNFLRASGLTICGAYEKLDYGRERILTYILSDIVSRKTPADKKMWEKETSGGIPGRVKQRSESS